MNDADIHIYWAAHNGSWRQLLTYWTNAEWFSVCNTKLKIKITIYIIIIIILLLYINSVYNKGRIKNRHIDSGTVVRRYLQDSGRKKFDRGNAEAYHKLLLGEIIKVVEFKTEQHFELNNIQEK